jgi:hypothetical protein
MTAATLATFDRSDALRIGRNYLRAGDPCRVSGERGVFRFVALVTNTATGSTWAEVVGPAANPRTRSFRIDRLRRVRRDTPTR